MLIFRLWAFATARVVIGDELYNAAARAVLLRAPSLEPRALATLAWSMARIGALLDEHDDGLEEDVFSSLALASLACLSEFDGQSLANLAWAFAKAEMESPRLMGGMAVEVR